MNDFLLIQPRPENLGGQPILRPLPSAKCRSVGPFVFFDHILENTYPAGSGMNINQHPHIGLSTLTYLFEGQLQHKDSLGSDQLVGPGEVSWMTAGRAVAHVERTPRICGKAARICMACRCGWPCPQQKNKANRATAITPPATCRAARAWVWISA